MRIKRLTIAGIVVRLLVLAAAVMAAGLAPRSVQIAGWAQAADRALQSGQYETALATYDRMMAALGPQAAIYERLVQASLAAGRDADARVYLYALAGRAGWNRERRRQLADMLERGGELDKAAALLDAGLDAASAAASDLRRLADAQIARQDWAGAETTLTALLTRDPGNAQALYQLGLLLAPHDRARAAVCLAEASADADWQGRAETVLAALSAYDRYAATDAHTMLGVTLAGLGEWAFAERMLLMALEANEVNPTAQAYLGFVRDRQGRDGLPDLQAALAMAPNDGQIHYLLGLHWRQMGDREAAYDSLRRAYWLDPGNPALAAEVGTALQDLGDLARAEEWLTLAVQMAPSEPRWSSVLAAFYADTGYELATRGLAFIEEAAARYPTDPDLRASLGWAYQQLNDAGRAYDELRAAVGMAPASVRSRYYFGIVLERRGDRAGAVDAYWYVLDKAEPGSRFALLARRALQRLGYLTS